MARSARSPQYWLQVFAIPSAPGRWRVRLQALADVCEEHVVEGLGYWEVGQEVHEILASLDVCEDWTITAWWSSRTS